MKYSALALMVCGIEAVPIRIHEEPGEFVRRTSKRWNCQNVLIQGVGAELILEVWTF